MGGAFPFMHETSLHHGENTMSPCRRALFARDGAVNACVQATDCGFYRFNFLDQCDTQDFVTATATIIAVAIRGLVPANVRDWAIDQDAEFVPGPFGRVDEGFEDGLDISQLA